VKEDNNIHGEATAIGGVGKLGHLGDSPDATKIMPGTGPSVEGLSEPIEGSTGDEENDAYLAKISQRINKKTKKNKKKSGKTINDNINICDMKNNGSNIFDKLYSVIMEDEELPAEFDLGGDDEGDLEGDEFGDELEGGDEVSFSLPRDAAEQLQDALAAALGGDDEEGLDDLEDFGDEEEEGFDDLDEMSFRETVSLGTVKEDGNPSALADGVSKMQNKNNKVKGKASNTKSGKANTGTVKVKGDPEALADGVARQQKGGKTGAKEAHIGD